MSLVVGREQLPRVQLGRPGRGAVICLLVAGPLVGAIVGAVLRKPPAFPERAEALVVVTDRASALGRVRTERVHTLATALASRPVVTAVKLEAGTPRLGIPVSGSVNVEPNPAAGNLTVIADADNGSAATALANSASSYAVLLASRVQAATNAPYSIPASDFANGIGTWGGPSQFALSPLSLRVSRRRSRYHDGSLTVTCSPVPGCGSSTSLELAGVPHHIYTGTIWVRALSSKIRATVFLGGDPKDVATVGPVTVTRTWRRLAVSWRASHPRSTIELGVLVSSRATTHFALDAASLTDGLAPPSSAQERRLFAGAGTAVAFPAVATGAVAGDTALSAALGGGAGLLAAVAGCVAGAVARRRQGDA